MSALSRKAIAPSSKHLSSFAEATVLCRHGTRSCTPRTPTRSRQTPAVPEPALPQPARAGERLRPWEGHGGTGGGDGSFRTRLRSGCKAASAAAPSSPCLHGGGTRAVASPGGRAGPADTRWCSAVVLGAAVPGAGSRAPVRGLQRGTGRLGPPFSLRGLRPLRSPRNAPPAPVVPVPGRVGSAAGPPAPAPPGRET